MIAATPVCCAADQFKSLLSIPNRTRHRTKDGRVETLNGFCRFFIIGFLLSAAAGFAARDAVGPDEYRDACDGEPPTWSVQLSDGAIARLHNRSTQTRYEGTASEQINIE